MTPAFPDTGRERKRGPLLSARLPHAAGAQVAHATRSRVVDRNGVAGNFDVVFSFVSVLRADGVPIGDGDPVAPNAELSPARRVARSDRATTVDFQLTVNGNAADLHRDPARARDTSRREWLLTLARPSATGEHERRARRGRRIVATTRFVTEAQTRDPATLMAFPNPFDDELGTHFSFTLTGGEPADVRCASSP